MTETEMLWRLASDAEDAGDFRRARQLAEQGAKLGDASCWLQLGLLYDLGCGVSVDKRYAMTCYRKAWLQKNVAAANNIAVLYREKGDYRAMFRWYARAAKHGDDGAFLELAKCYRDGVGVKASERNTLRSLAAALRGSCISEAEREEAAAILQDYRPRALS